ncbi:hypothetical protein GGR51DRAFT_512562 [Nemania sp. FL0031]|nr:hypothetical protein GGR51DRAFT_512562 [Nemania sp. FL0031]
MANGSKRFHSKSRNGCGQCKRRRVRCNLQGPICSNCHRRNEFCDYLRDYHYQSSEIEISRSHVHTTLFNPGLAPRLLQGVTPIDEYAYLSSCTELFIALDYYPGLINEGELLAYTTTFFSETDRGPFTPSQDERSLWKGNYDYQNKRLEYLLPTISSLCAIHETLQRGSQFPGTHVRALQHNITASTRFRHTEKNVHDSNWIPMLIFGVGYIMFNFAAAQSMPDRDFDYLSIFHILRGTAQIGDEIGVFLEKSGLGDILERRRQWVVDPSDLSDILQAIDRLGSVAHPMGTSETMRAHCEHALGRLKWWTQYVQGVPRTWKHFILWPASVTDGFVTTLVEKQPVALLVYIYWCVVMHRAPRRWYADGWHLRVAVAAMSDLGPEYATLLDWPSLALGTPLVTDIL